jgi:hypothetical protein
MLTATNTLLCNRTVALLWKCNELIVTQQELLRYYSNATTDLTCHNIITFFGPSAYTNPYSCSIRLAFFFFEKTGYKHKWYKLYFRQEQITNNNGLVFKCCILHNIIMRYIKNSLVVEFPDFLPSGLSIHFIPCWKDRILTVQRKIRTVGNAAPTWCFLFTSWHQHYQ